ISPDPIEPARAWAMPSPISPAPSTSTRLPSSVPSCSAAIATAACDTDVVPREIAVSDRARLPTSTACPNTPASTAPPTPPSPPPPRTPEAGHPPRAPPPPEDLAFTDDCPVEPRRHLEQVSDGGVLVVAVEVVSELVR